MPLVTDNPKPNFFITGARKSGTTSIYHYIKQHPEAFLSPVKETSFFAINGEEPEIAKFGIQNCPSYQRLQKNSIKTEIDYKNLFLGIGKEKVIGEASPYYLYHPKVAERIFQFNPKAKLLAILRNPYDAAYSTYLMTKRLYAPQKDFIALLKEENHSDENYWSSPRYIRERFYDQQLLSYLKIFPKDQIKVVLFEDLEKPEELMESIFSYLEIDSSYVTNTKLKYNMESQSSNVNFYHNLVNKISHKHKAQVLRWIPGFIKNMLMKKRLLADEHNPNPTKCPQEAKNYLGPIFNPHIIELEKILDRDLSHWLV